jgi:subtilase family serine protease
MQHAKPSTFAPRRTAIAAVLAATAALAANTAHAAGSWASTATQAAPLQNITGAVPIAAAQQLHVVLGLNPRNKSQLDALAMQINTPHSPQFGQTLTPAQFLATYAPTTAQVNQVVSYLSGAGFSNIQVSPNNLSISADGSAAQVQSAFNTRLVSFTALGKSMFANSTPAQVPAALGGVVAAVIGLQNMGTMSTMIQHRGASTAARGTGSLPASESLPGGVPQDPLTNYSGPQYQTIYDAASTPSGLGTAIGIVSEGNITQVPIDLRSYEKLYGLPQVPYEIVPVGPQTTSTSGLDEFDLDSQSSSGIAQNLREIIFYNAGSLADDNLTPVFEQIVSEDRVKAVNMSFGGCETFSYLDGSMLVDDIAFEQGVVEGITFFASAGDGGASCQLLINAGEPVLLGMVEYPASSEYVVAVGGTSLYTNSNYSYDFETAWESGGGGVSQWEVPGPWTSGIINPVSTQEGLRAIPDIAMVGDPNIGGANIVVNGAQEGVGGTSLSSPLSVGSWARLQAAHGECYGFAAPIFYATFGQPYLTSALDFHDIILGDNVVYPATPGWDYTTGLGSFDIATVNGALPAISCAPEVPYSLGGGPVNGQVLLSWGTSPGATSYAVYAGTASGAEGATAIATTGNNSTVISGLAGTEYFTVKALNAKGSSPASNELSVSIPVAVPASLGVTGTPAASSVSLSWSASTNASDYYVFVGTTPGGESGKGIYSAGTATTITGLSSGTKYYFTVKAYNHPTGLSSAASNEVSAATAP